MNNTQGIDLRTRSKVEKKEQYMNKQDMSYFKSMFPISLDAYHVWSALLGAITAFIWEVQPFIVLLIVLVLVDLVTGMIRAHHEKQKIHSFGIYRTVEKIFIQMVTILVAELVRVVLFPPLDLTYVVVFVIAMSEFKSIIENAESILGLKIWKYISQLIKSKFNGNDSK